MLPGAKEFTEFLSIKDIPYFYLTNNSSKSRVEYVEKLGRLGLAVREEHILTSGEATALTLRKEKPGARIYLVGTEALRREFERFGFVLVEEDPDYAVLGFDTSLTYEKLWKLCNFARRGIRYVATHPDLNCPTEDGYMPDIGATIAFVEASSGRRPDLVVGKPNPAMVSAVAGKTGLALDQLAMVGDRLYTDIAMGVTGITTILVLSGETRREDLAGAEFQPDLVVENLMDLYEMYREL